MEIDDDVEAPREDGQWGLEARWRYPITPAVGLQLGYAFESRLSNDPDKLYDAHLFDVAFVYTLWRGGASGPRPHRHARRRGQRRR